MAGKNLCETWELCLQTFSGKKEAKDPNSAAFTSDWNLQGCLWDVFAPFNDHFQGKSRPLLSLIYIIIYLLLALLLPFSSFPNLLSKLLVELLTCKFDHVTSFLKTFQKLLMAFRVKENLITLVSTGIHNLDTTHLGSLIFYPHHFTHAISQICYSSSYANVYSYCIFP